MSQLRYVTGTEMAEFHEARIGSTYLLKTINACERLLDVNLVAEAAHQYPPVVRRKLLAQIEEVKTTFYDYLRGEHRLLRVGYCLLYNFVQKLTKNGILMMANLENDESDGSAQDQSCTDENSVQVNNSF